MLSSSAFVRFSAWLLFKHVFLLAGAAEQNAFFIVWVIPSLLLGLCGLFIWNKHKNGRNADVVLGVLCATAIIAALIVSTYAHSSWLYQYWQLGHGASYFNVIPSELAAGRSDASSIVFTNASRVDTAHTYGFVDANSATGDLYCVAPIATGDAVTDMRVQYWAAGIDCCFPRSNFHCGEAANVEAHGALVFSRKERNRPQWDLAIAGAQKAYGLQVGEVGQ